MLVEVPSGVGARKVRAKPEVPTRTEHGHVRIARWPAPHAEPLKTRPPPEPELVHFDEKLQHRTRHGPDRPAGRPDVHDVREVPVFGPACRYPDGGRSDEYKPAEERFVRSVAV